MAADTSLSRERFYVGLLAGLAVAGAWGYYWFEIRGPWERRICEALIGFTLQVPGSYRRLAADSVGSEWRIRFSAQNRQNMPITGRATCSFTASEWRERRMQPIVTLFMLDGDAVDASPYEEPARRIADAW